MNKQLTATVMALVVCIPLLLTGCWRKKSMAVGVGSHEIAISKTDTATTSRYGIDAK